MSAIYKWYSGGPDIERIVIPTLLFNILSSGYTLPNYLNSTFK